MKSGDYVVIKEAKGSAGWAWTDRKGHITETDKYCHTVRTDDGDVIRDVIEHFRLVRV